MTHRGRLNALIRAQFGHCAGCGTPLSEARIRNADEAPSIDHVWPISLGGSNHISNCVAMHRRCNCEKRDRAPNGCDLLWQLVARAGLSVRFIEMPDYRLIPRDATLGDIWPAMVAA